MKRISTTLCSLLLAVLLAPLSALAITVQDLENNNHLKIKSWLEPGKDIVVGEQVILYIEVATDRWFTSGTNIGLFDIEDAIVLRRKKLANNYTQRENGKTWSHQQWEITLYPQVSGEFIVPPIPVTIEVSASTREKVQGTLLTQPHRFKTELPSGYLTEENNWITAPALDVTQKWNIKDDDELSVGDAVTRTTVITADDTTSMLFPKLQTSTQNDSAAGYLSPLENEDTQNRGDYGATHTEQSTWIVQKAGDFTLPPLTVYWWNTQTDALETITLEGRTWQVKHTPMSFVKAYWHFMVLGVALVVLIGYALFAANRWYRKNKQANTLPLWMSFAQAIKVQDWPLINHLIYKRMYRYQDKYCLADYDTDAEDSSWAESREKMQTANYSTDENKPSVSTAQKLWSGIKKKQQQKRFGFKDAVPALKTINRK